MNFWGAIPQTLDTIALLLIGTDVIWQNASPYSFEEVFPTL